MMISGEPMRLTAAEWARVPKIEPPSGPAEMAYGISEAQYDRDPADPLMTYEEYLALRSRKDGEAPG